MVKSLMKEFLYKDSTMVKLDDYIKLTKLLLIKT